jgi:hypothetical protein
MASRFFLVSLTGANSYVAAKQLRSRGRKHTERCIARVWHLYRDLGTDCDTRLTSLRASEALPMSVAFISISPGTYQVQWRIDCSPFQRQESTLKLLRIAFGRDRVHTNVGRIPHTPGYLSCKYDTTYSITVEYPSDSTWNPDDFRARHCCAERHPSGLWKAHQFRTRLGVDPARSCPRKRHQESLPTLASRRADLPRFSFTAPQRGRCRNRPSFGSSTLSRRTTSSRCLKFAVTSRSPQHSAPLRGARLRSLRRRWLPGERLFDFVAYIRRISATT